MSSSLYEKETYWSRFAADFEEKNTYVVGKDNFDKLGTYLETFSDMGHLLELGCGNGTYTKILCSKADAIVATDYSDEMLATLPARLANYSNIRFQKENCFDLSFEPSTYDTVFMANLLHIIPEPEKALNECHRVLKPGGRLIVVSFTVETLSQEHIEGLQKRYVDAYGLPSPHSYMLTQASAETMVTDTGFEVCSNVLVGDTMKAIVVEARKK